MERSFRKVRLTELVDTFVFDEEKMDDIKSEIRKNIVELRKKNNLSISELGTLANVSPGQVVKIEKGTSTPSMETLLKLSVVLQVPLSELLPCEVSNRETLGTKIDQLTQPYSRKVKNHILRICTELVQFDKNYDKIKW